MEDRAVSEIVSVIFIVVLVIVLAAVVFSLLTGNFPLVPKPGFVAPEIGNQTVEGKNVIRLMNRAGDAIVIGGAGEGQYVMDVYVDTPLGTSLARPVAGSGSFGPGETLYIFQDKGGNFWITRNPGDVGDPEADSIPVSGIAVRLVDPRSQILIARWSSAETGPGALSVTSISPASWWAGSTLPLAQVAGSGFTAGVGVRLTRTGSSDIPASNISVISTGKITCSISIPPSAAPGQWNVVVTKPADGSSASLANGFSVLPAIPAPTVSSMNVSNGNRGWPVTRSITGTNFVSGATSRMTRPGTPDIPATGCTVVSPTQVICTYDLRDRSPSPPNYDVVVINPDGKSGMRTNYFVLNSPAPTITSSSPSSGMQGTTVTITSLSGTNFQPGATVTYSQGSTVLPLTGVTVVSPTRMTGTLTIPGSAPTGSYSVTVTNTDGKTVTRTGVFTVTSNAPTLSARSPSSGNRGWPLTFTLTGTNFQPGATVQLTRTGSPDIPVSSISVVNSTWITCTLNLLGVYVPPGTGGTGSSTWNVTVTNPDGKSVTRTNWFTVNSPSPSIPTSSVFSPNTGARGTTVTITFTGANFQPGASVTFTRSPTTIPAYNVVVASPTQITCTIDIPTGATTGNYSATVTNTDGRSGTQTNRFTVT